ncbi:MAG: DUF502 domain-containing protein, partial [Candidatus Hydrogenedentes bacterium]|nr:DUF502 domain-containing protein [Candidatus Hydrogenedentota bacterium]
HEGARTIGFLVGKVTSKNGREYYKVFVPTTPNVTVGLLEFFNRGDISGCSLSLEEAIKMVVSGGIVGPSAISTVPLSDEIHSDTASPIRSI